MVIEVDTFPRGRSASRMRMSSRLEMATPVRPTSPRAMGWSESRPIWVGRSKATDRPVCPEASKRLNRWLVLSAEPKPAYWRMVHNRDRCMVG
jgi:hypothetical protein